jgi:hypothetical protein
MKCQAVHGPDTEIVHPCVKLQLSHQWKAHTLRVFDNKVMRRVFEYTREEATRGWRKLHNEELNHLALGLCLQLFVYAHMYVITVTLGLLFISEFSISALKDF